MIKSLTIVYVTARYEPKILWFYQSFAKQCTSDNVKIIVVDTFYRESDVDRARVILPFFKDGMPPIIAQRSSVRLTSPKPTIWQGEHRITKEDWWAKCNALNTGIVLCDTEWIAFVDDRSVLAHGWLQCVQDSMLHGYAVCGSYEKRANMKVENGEIVEAGQFLGMDDRPQRGFPVPTVDWYGGSSAVPLEWCLRVNGFPEDICDGLGFEDVAFGLLLKNNHLPMYYDSRMKIIEDRTPTEIGGALRRGGKQGPNTPWDDKDYKILDIMRATTVSQNSYDLTELRERTLKGEPFPPPTADHRDWFDGQPISEMT